MKCYDPQGNEHNKESIDARECIQFCGYTLERQVAAVIPVVVEIAKEVKTEVIERVRDSETPKIKRGRPAVKR